MLILEDDAGYSMTEETPLIKLHFFIFVSECQPKACYSLEYRHGEFLMRGQKGWKISLPIRINLTELQNRDFCSLSPKLCSVLNQVKIGGEG